MTRHKTTNVDGLSVFYREAGDPANPKLLLLGGFPAAHPDSAFDELLEYPGGGVRSSALCFCLICRKNLCNRGRARRPPILLTPT